MKLRLLCSLLFTAMYFMSSGQTVGVVGSATPNGWDGPDIEMTAVPDSVGLFTATATLIDGAAKFRLDNEWTTNWGGSDFPSGVAEAGGDDIPVYAGEYTITFDTVSGAYDFQLMSPIGIIGDAIAGTEWSEDVDMYEDTNGVFFVDISLQSDKAVKFRLDNDWIVAWGADSFPSGIATTDGGNIPVDKAGDYHVTFDTTSGEYNFGEIITYSSIGIIGSATANGWDGDDIDLTQSSSDPNVWEGNITLGEGEIKFRANDDWIIDWGGSAFPMDTAVLKGDNITVVPGDYLVTFNTETLVYEFLEVIYYESVGIIGDAVDGWDADDREMVRSEMDSAQWSLRTILNDGEAKFRAEDNWDIAWGAGNFPSGTAEMPGTNVPITAGEYIINFNTTTRAYEFIELIIYDSVSIVGSATGVEDGNGGWDTDIFLEKDAEDEQLWQKSPVDLVEGECKFRVNAAWDVNWGVESWPSGVGEQGGDNIPVTAGSYFVSIRTDDGSFSFQDPSFNKNESILSEIKVYPNPSSGFINIEMNSELITGSVNLQVIDVTGRTLITTVKQGSGNARLDVSSLAPGNYYLKMYNKKFLVAKPISVK